MERAIFCALLGLDNFGKQHFPPPLKAFLLRSVWNWWYIFYSELTTRNKHFDWLHQGLAHMCTLLPASSVSDRFASWKCKWMLLKKMGLRLLEKPSFSVPWTWFLCPSVRTCMCEPVLCRQQGFGWKECGKKYLVPSVKQNPCQKWGTFHLQRGKFLGRNHARFCQLKMDFLKSSWSFTQMCKGDTGNTTVRSSCLFRLPSHPYFVCYVKNIK